MELSSPELSLHKPFEERVRHYQSRAERLLSRYGRDFAHFTEDYKSLVEQGDLLMKAYEATGYNIARRAGDMPLSSEKPLMFYSNYIGRPRHFGLLLSEMEHKGIIVHEQIRLGVMASKVLLGDWEPDPSDEQIAYIQRVDRNAVVSEHPVSQSVNTLAIFSPRDDVQALEIARFLLRRASSTESGFIGGSWETPDMRATVVLKNPLINAGFREVIANMRSIGQGRLIAVRQTTQFTPSWQSVPIEMNEKLATYLASRGVPS